jgi:hypothetical protein
MTFAIASHYFAAGKPCAAKAMEFCQTAAHIAEQLQRKADAVHFWAMARQSALTAGNTTEFQRHVPPTEAAAMPQGTVTNGRPTEESDH